MAELIVWLRALADETRLRVFRLLVEFPEGLCVIGYDDPVVRATLLRIEHADAGIHLEWGKRNG